MADLAVTYNELPIAGRPYLVPDDTTQSVQAAAQGVVIDDGDYLTFFDEKFRLADRVGIMPMLAFGMASKQGLDSDDMEGLAALYSLIRSVIHRPPLLDDEGARVRDANGKALRNEAEWDRFQALAEDEQAEGEDLMEFVNKAMEVMSARPRKPRAVSSATSRTTSGNSRAGSSSPGMPLGADGLMPIRDLAR